MDVSSASEHPESIIPQQMLSELGKKTQALARRTLGMALNFTQTFSSWGGELSLHCLEVAFQRVGFVMLHYP
jgi:hypothetical protein